MQRVWLIRAGQDSEEIDPMRRAGLIAVKFAEVGDASASTATEIEQALLDAGRSTAAQITAQINAFARTMKPGDLVITPNTARREVWLSRVSGDYHYDTEPAIAGYSHSRPVEWLGWLDRDAYWMSDQLKAIDQPVVITELYNREWWWKQYDTKELSALPRVSWSKPAATKAPRSAAAPRTRSSAPAKPKPGVTPRPKPVAMVLCSGQCGLQWAPQILVGGLCPDCRGD